MSVTVNLDNKNSIQGVWLDVEKGEVCVYHDASNYGIVVGHYENKNSEPIKTALSFTKNKECILQTHDGTKYHWTKLDPEKVSVKIVEFLNSLEDCDYDRPEKS